MDTFDAVDQRRAIKHYDPQHKLTPEEGTKDPWPKPGQLPLSELVKENRF